MLSLPKHATASRTLSNALSSSGTHRCTLRQAQYDCPERLHVLTDPCSASVELQGVTAQATDDYPSSAKWGRIELDCESGSTARSLGRSPGSGDGCHQPSTPTIVWPEPLRLASAVARHCSPVDLGGPTTRSWTCLSRRSVKERAPRGAAQRPAIPSLADPRLYVPPARTARSTLFRHTFRERGGPQSCEGRRDALCTSQEATKPL